MNLKRQLLLVSLLTLVLPWAGCQFIGETESALRSGQQRMLAGTARAIADSMAQYEDEFPLTNQDDHVVGDSLYGHRIDSRPNIDGYFDDWNLSRDALRSMRGADGPIQFAIGLHEQFIYLYVEVADKNVIYAAPGTIAVGQGPRFSDRVGLVNTSPPYLDEVIMFGAEAPGSIISYVQTAYGFAPDPSIVAHWQDVPSRGYQLEARIPASRLGTHIGLQVSNTSDALDTPTRSASFSASAPGPFVTRSDELVAIAARRTQPGMRLILTDAAGWRVATAGGIALPANDSGGAVSAWMRIAYEAVVESGQEAELAEPNASGRESQPYVVAALQGEASETWFRSADGGGAVVAVAQPIESGGTIFGALVLQQGTEAILSLTNERLAQLIYVTVIATLVVALALLGYASWLSSRIQKLSIAAEDALENDDLRSTLPSALDGDEVGDLSRSFSHVLHQLGEYNEYLRTLASKLSHELRTPLAIVSSSLENLEHEPLNAASAEYAARAKSGADRLRRILTAMSEASRVEELMQHAEAVDFDVHVVLKSTVAAYSDVYPARRFEFESDLAQGPASGSPELMIQMLDKLVDNAVDFSSNNDTIKIGLEQREGSLVVTVTNPGPSLPERMRTQLFDSMVSVRSSDGDEHLGLGLYIAKLISEGHGGGISADNIEGGVVFSVTLPKRD
jgi:two-component system sensor histidine kinase ChvG